MYIWSGLSPAQKSFKKSFCRWPVVMVHACNPSYSGGRGGRTASPGKAWDPIWKIN
jgi:hypothetical protein